MDHLMGRPPTRMFRAWRVARVSGVKGVRVDSKAPEVDPLGKTMKGAGKPASVRSVWGEGEARGRGEEREGREAKRGRGEVMGGEGKEGRKEGRRKSQYGELEDAVTSV